MKRSLLFFVILTALTVMSTSAQTKTVTNADLEKYRQARLKAEQDYRENYAKRGLPSPEELRRLDEKKAKERSELADKLRARDAETARLTAQARQEAARYSYYSIVPVPSARYYSSPYTYAYPGYVYSRRYYNRRSYGNIPYNSNTPVVLTIPRFDWLPGSILPAGAEGIFRFSLVN